MGLVPTEMDLIRYVTQLTLEHIYNPRLLVAAHTTSDPVACTVTMITLRATSEALKIKVPSVTSNASGCNFIVAELVKFMQVYILTPLM